MSQRANHFKLGVFVITGFVLLVGGLMLLGAGDLLREPILAETYFDESVQGLSIGSPVKYRGVKLGEVCEISFAGHDYPEAETDRYRRLIMVRFDLSAGLGEPEHMRRVERFLTFNIEQGLRARLQSQGITGLTYVAIDYVDPERHELPDYPWTPRTMFVPSVPSQITELGTTLEQISTALRSTNLERIGADIEQITRRINDSLERAPLVEIGESANRLVADLSRTNQRVLEILDSPEVDATKTDMKEATANARQLLAKSDEALQDLMEDVARTTDGINETRERLNVSLDDVQALLRNSREISEKLPATLARFDRTLARFETMLASQQNRIEELIANWAATSAHARDLGESTSRYPSLILLGEPPPRLEEDQP